MYRSRTVEVRGSGSRSGGGAGYIESGSFDGRVVAFHYCLCGFGELLNTRGDQCREVEPRGKAFAALEQHYVKGRTELSS